MRSEPQVAKEEAFKVKLDNIFDVAHTDALKMMTDAEDKVFLLTNVNQANVEEGKHVYFPCWTRSSTLQQEINK